MWPEDILGRTGKREAGTAQRLVSRDLRGWFHLKNKALLGCRVPIGREAFMGRTVGEGPCLAVSRAEVQPWSSTHQHRGQEDEEKRTALPKSPRDSLVMSKCVAILFSNFNFEFQCQQTFMEHLLCVPVFSSSGAEGWCVYTNQML